MNLCGKLLEAVDDSRPGPQQKVVVDVIHAVRARGRRLAQSLDLCNTARPNLNSVATAQRGGKLIAKYAVKLVEHG